MFSTTNPEKSKTHYETLGILPTASAAEIKTAYHSKARECHPDKEPDPVKKQATTLRFQAVQTAYSVLSDDIARTTYDFTLRFGKINFGGSFFAQPQPKGFDEQNYFFSLAYDNPPELYTQNSHKIINAAKSSQLYFLRAVAFETPITKLKCILQKNPSLIKQCDDYGNNAFHVAILVSLRHPEYGKRLFSFLRDQGCDACHKNNEKLTPTHLLAILFDEDTWSIFVKLGIVKEDYQQREQTHNSKFTP